MSLEAVKVLYTAKLLKRDMKSNKNSSICVVFSDASGFS